jgi:hypoxanthine phosphoribosyltransferase
MNILEYNDSNYREKQEQEEKEKFAIAFHRWMRKNDTIDNADKYFHFTDKDMLNEFKKEKGL